MSNAGYDEAQLAQPPEPNIVFDEVDLEEPQPPEIVDLVSESDDSETDVDSVDSNATTEVPDESESDVPDDYEADPNINWSDLEYDSSDTTISD